ncbi:hypothetical protein KW787_00705 [Candidatus Pacearchaeota archaeon]|nr:hypothetical protein [Candidatus Pacearchaeota archaeon]
MELKYNHDVYENKKDFVLKQFRYVYTALKSACYSASAKGVDAYISDISLYADYISRLSDHSSSIPLEILLSKEYPIPFNRGVTPLLSEYAHLQ